MRPCRIDVPERLEPEEVEHGATVAAKSSRSRRSAAPAPARAGTRRRGARAVGHSSRARGTSSGAARAPRASPGARARRRAPRKTTATRSRGCVACSNASTRARRDRGAERPSAAPGCSHASAPPRKATTGTRASSRSTARRRAPRPRTRDRPRQSGVPCLKPPAPIEPVGLLVLGHAHSRMAAKHLVERVVPPFWTPPMTTSTRGCRPAPLMRSSRLSRAGSGNSTSSATEPRPAGCTMRTCSR